MTQKVKAITGFRAAAFTAALLTATAAHAQLLPFTSGGVSWKSFKPSPGNFVTPATPGVFRWWPTGYPEDDAFVKRFDQTGLYCFGMFDVQMGAGYPGDVIMMGITLDAPDKTNYPGGISQGLYAPEKVPGQTNDITFSFGYVWGGAGHGHVRAGIHHLDVWMATADGEPAIFSNETNLQCIELALPESQ